MSDLDQSALQNRARDASLSGRDGLRHSETGPAERQAGRADSSRVAVLDGIRGWASLAVLLFHVLPETNRGVLPELNSDVVFVLFDGALAVYVFFILSGEALSTGYLRTKDTRVVRSLAARRYFRLTLPILMACLLVYCSSTG